MKTRPLQRGESEVVSALWNRAAVHDTLSVLPAPGRDQLITDGDIVGLAVGVLRRDASRGYVKLLAVDPLWQRQHIGTALLAAIENGLIRKGARSIRPLESAPNYLAPGIDARYEAALGFAEASGYRPVGEARNLSVDLTQRSTPRRVPHGIELRRPSREDAARLHDFLAAHWPAWTSEARVALGNRPPTLHLALRDDCVVGFAAWDANNRGTGWFGPMGVAPEERGAGIGCVLLQRCLDDMREQGHDAAVIAWVDNAPFYERCAGAVPWRTFARFEKVLHED